VHPGNLSQIDDQIERMREQVSTCDNHIQKLWSALMDHLESESVDDEVMKVVNNLRVEQDNKDKYMLALVKLYQSQVQIIQNTGVYVTPEQKKTLDAEMKKMKDLSNKGYRTGKFSTETQIPDSLFTTFLDEVIENCPLITSVIESLLVFNRKERNVNKTSTYKMLCASQSLSVLLNLRNSRAMNDIVLLFGILCISFGAGKQFINMLSALGLTLHWDTLYVIPISLLCRVSGGLL
jgi:uncharacterized protein (UPF0335 family)